MTEHVSTRRSYDAVATQYACADHQAGDVITMGEWWGNPVELISLSGSRA